VLLLSHTYARTHQHTYADIRTHTHTHTYTHTHAPVAPQAGWAGSQSPHSVRAGRWLCGHLPRAPGKSYLGCRRVMVRVLERHGLCWRVMVRVLEGDGWDVYSHGVVYGTMIIMSENNYQQSISIACAPQMLCSDPPPSPPSLPPLHPQPHLSCPQ
jgi:hypothetical protein